LIGLKDRVEALSGRLGIASLDGTGTAISVTIPLPTGG
jgi:signal transduction histidine kinase